MPRLMPDADVVKVSVIGVGMRSHAGVAQKMFRTLADKGDQHPGDLDLGDQGERADRRGIYRAGGAGAAHRLRAGRRVATEARRRDPWRRRVLDGLWRRGREFLGVEYAIMGGAMSWISERHLVAAISNAGGFGVIACGSMNPEQLAAEIEATQTLTARPFGVNLITMHPQLMELIDVCARAPGRPCRAGRRVAAGRGHGPHQGVRRQADVLRADRTASPRS